MTVMTKISPPAEGDVQITPHKSGYARDVRPDLVNPEEAAGHVVPVASEKGAQAGRVPPAKRKTTTYKALTAAEADKLLRDRHNGRAPRIAGGLDDPAAPVKEPTQYDDNRMETFDAPDATPDAPKLELSDVSGMQALLALLKPVLTAMRPVERVGLTPHAVVERVPIMAPAPNPVPPQPARARVQLQIEGAGTYSMSAIDVVRAGFGVFVLLPCGPNDAVFTPNPGSAVRILFKDKVYDCYFPGVAGELPGLNVMLLAMIDKPAAE